MIICDNPTVECKKHLSLSI